MIPHLTDDVCIDVRLYFPVRQELVQKSIIYDLKGEINEQNFSINYGYSTCFPNVRMY